MQPGINFSNISAENSKSSILGDCWPACAVKSDKIIIVRKSNFVDKILMCPIRSSASDGLLTLFGITSDMKLSQNLYLMLLEVRHPMERLVSAYRHVFERQQGYEDQLIKMASMREVGISSGDNGVLTGIMW